MPAVQEVFEFLGQTLDSYAMKNAIESIVSVDTTSEWVEPVTSGRQGIFLRRGTMFLKTSRLSDFSALVTPAVPAVERSIFKVKDAKTILVRAHRCGMEYTALVNGYLSFSETDGFFIIDPLVISPDKMRMDFILAPVIFGRNDLVDYFFEKKFEKNSGDIAELPIERKTIEILADSYTVRLLHLKKGRAPIASTPGFLNLKFPEILNHEDRNKIDYHELSPFHEVHKGDLLAELTPSIPGIPGVDVFGNETYVEPVNEIIFHSGQNIAIAEECGKKLFISLIDGVASIKRGSISVSPELIINGDVGLETGNLRFCKNIKITGNVIGGSKIFCGGNLEIRGNVENSANIECHGNLVIKNGLLGLDTRCVVYQNSQIGFIQESNLKTGGNLTIDSFIYNSIVFCRGEILVNGKNISGTDRGSVIGGKVSAMKSIVLHSVGSAAVKTEILTGIDPQSLQALKQARSAEAALVGKIRMIQSSIGINLQDPASVSKLKSMPETFKIRLKNRINEMKRLIQNHQTISGAIPKLEHAAFSTEMEKNSISILNHLSPDVLFRIGTASKLCVEFCKKIKFKLDKDRIVMFDL